MSLASATERSSPQVWRRVEAALKMVPGVVAQIARCLPAHAREEDLRSFGNEGALIAGRTFDAELGVPFRWWAIRKIRAGILDGLRTEAELPRRLYARVRALEAARAAEEGRPEERTRTGGLEVARAADSRLDDHLAALATAYAAGVLMTRSDATLQSLRDAQDTPEETLEREQLKSSIWAAIRARPAQERMLLERYYRDGVTLAEASGGRSTAWASRLHARAIRGLARSLRSARVVASP